VGGIVRRGKRSMVVYLLIAGVMALLFMRLPTSFLPDEDQAFLQVQVTLPPGASDARLQPVVEQVQDYFGKQPEVVSVNVITGQNGDQSSARAFVKLKDWAERTGKGQSAAALARRANKDLSTMRDARMFVLLPPAVRGLGANAGFNFHLKDINGLGHDALVKARDQVIELLGKRPEVVANVRSNNLDDTPQFAVDIDDARAGALSLATSDIDSTLSSAMGGTYINDFLDNGRVKRVYMQGDTAFRMLPADIDRWSVRNALGQMVPFPAFSSSRWTYGSPQLQRYNGSPSYEFVGDAAPGVSSGDAMAAVDEVMKQMPPGIGYEWTGASFQERLSGAQAPLLYAISILFVFLCLAALYESWSVPFSVILVVPLGIVGALLFTSLRGLSNDVYFQVGPADHGGAVVEERDPDRGVRQAAAGAGQGRDRGHAAGRAPAAAAHPDDLAGLRLRRAAAGHRHRRGRGRPPVDRHRGAGRHGGGHGAGHLLRAAVLRADPRLAGGPAKARPRRSSQDRYRTRPPNREATDRASSRFRSARCPARPLRRARGLRQPRARVLAARLAGAAGPALRRRRGATPLDVGWRELLRRPRCRA
jgi:hypothetical protein